MAKILSEQHKKNISGALRKKISEGWTPDSSHLVKGWSHLTQDQINKRVKKVSKILKGRPQRMDTVCGAHENHKNAKYWVLDNKSLGITLEGKNLSHLIRLNKKLFDDYDVESGNAGRGLRSLFHIKNRELKNNSWKGWTIGDKWKP